MVTYYFCYRIILSLNIQQLILEENRDTIIVQDLIRTDLGNKLHLRNIFDLFKTLSILHIFRSFDHMKRGALVD